MMMKQVVCLIFSVTLCFYIAIARAVTVSGLYNAQTPVASRSNNERNQGLQKALSSVLVKVSGKSDLFDIPDIKQAMKRPINYLGEYDFESVRDGDQPFQLNVSFNQQAINSLLTRSGLPVWSNNRPMTLIWLVVKDQFGLQMLGNDSTHPIIELLRQAAAKRGIPILFPMLDLTALQQVNANDIWSLQLGALETVSKRYAPNDILIMRFDMTDEQRIVSAWTLLLNGKPAAWKFSNSNIEQIVSQGINHVTTSLADQFAVKKAVNQKNQITLVVSNLTDINQYARVLRYFRKLNGVINIDVLSISRTKASFGLTVACSIDVLKRSIALDSMLTPKQQEFSQDQQTTVLNYAYENRS